MSTGTLHHKTEYQNHAHGLPIETLYLAAVNSNDFSYLTYVYQDEILRRVALGREMPPWSDELAALLMVRAAQKAKESA